ncbi:MAG TPA: tetratricopeptide repeat protein [Pirellulales bacterium]|jgi:tetratricopeptide (TPR) repeat protein|nr:tetratricopeptide repeat protein [Pirellulales bacterium]
MSRRLCSRIAHSRSLILSAFLTAIAGCATVDASKTSPNDPANKPASETSSAKPASPSVAEQREQRRKMVAAEFDQQRDRAQYQAGLSRWQQGDATGCREALTSLLARNPDHREAQLLAAQLDLFDDKPKQALDRARHVLVAHANDAQAHYEAALALDALGGMADALPHYEKAAQLAPREEAYQASYQAALKATLPPPDGHVGSINTPDRLDRAVSDGKSDCAGGDGESADSDSAVRNRLAAFYQSANAHPDDSQIPLDATVYALREDRPEAAIEIATAALRNFPDSSALYRVLGMAQYRHGDFTAARVSLGRALVLDKSNALAYFLMGSTLARLGEADAARRHFDEAARLDPRYGNRPD